jgi:hypothetical protein
MRSRRNNMLWLLAAGVCVRVLFGLLYRPILFPDSSQYLELAGMIGRGDWSGYTGARTPVYSLVLLLCGGNAELVTLFQALEGLLISAALYLIFESLYGDPRAGLAAGLSYALNPSQAVFERAVLTETTSTLLIVASVLFFVRGLRKKEDPGSCLLTGAASGAAGLIRPLMQFLPLLLAGILAVHHFLRVERKLKSAAVRFLLASLPAIILLCGWSAFNYSRTGYFGVTTLGGFNLMNHTGAFIEYAPPRYETIKDVYLAHRERVRNESGTSSMTIWSSIDDLREATGLSYAALSKELTGLSLYLILHHPGLYLRSVAESFTIFWLPTWYTGHGGFLAQVRSGGRTLKGLLLSYGAFHAACMLIFLALPVLYFMWPGLRKRLPFDFGTVTIYTLVLATAVLQALLEYGENARYKQSVEPLIIAVAVCSVLALLVRIRPAGNSSPMRLTAEKPIRQD